MHPVDWAGKVNAICIVCARQGLGNGIVYECDAGCGGKACGIHGATAQEDRGPGKDAGL
jgi:hypothetical protein